MLAAAQVVQAIADALRTVPAWADKVHTDRAHPFAEAELPAWRVVADDEDIELATVHWPATEQHTLLVDCEGSVRALDGLDAELNAMAEQALGALFGDLAKAQLGFGGRVTARCSRIGRRQQGDGEAAFGVVTLTLSLGFRVRQNAPDTIL